MGCSFFYIHCKALVFSLMNRVAGVVWIGLNSDFMCFSLIVRAFDGVSRKAVRRQYEGTTKAVGYQSRYPGCLFDIGGFYKLISWDFESVLEQIAAQSEGAMRAL